MRVVFNCTFHNFHREYCESIAEEIARRNGEALFADGPEENSGRYEVDFCIQPDEACERLGAKIGVWINHALPVIPQNDFYFGEPFKSSLAKNADYIFTFSDAWKEWHEMYGLPVHAVGLPKLDNYFSNIEGGHILYAPTHPWKPGVYSGPSIDQERLQRYGSVIFRGHPAYHPDQETSMESLKKASIVISDYSSMGLEAIILNIPTILMGQEQWRNVKTDHISERADAAATRVYSQDELEVAIRTYLDNPKHLEDERLKYSKLLCENQGHASKKFVDVLEGFL